LLLRDETFMGLSLPFLPKRLALEQQNLLPPRVSLLQQGDEDGDSQEQ
jgi:hypothetical protein